MKCLLITLFSLFLLNGCLGDKELEKKTKVDIPKLVGILTNVEFDKEILAGEGFDITGHFDFSVKNMETGEEEECKGNIFRKEYPESFFYFYVDCYGNFMYNLLRKN